MDTPRTVRPLFLLLPLAACMAAPLAAQYRGLSAGLGGDANGVTIFDDLGVGALFTVESRLNRHFAINFHGGASLPVSRIPDLGSNNMFLGFEAQLFLRCYLLSPPEMDTPRGAELFLDAGGGLIAVMNGQDSRDTRGSPEVSAILGLRIRLGKRFYVEPYARGGYPFYFGGGFVAGLRFPAKDVVKTVTVVADKPQEAVMIVNLVEAGAEVPEVVEIEKFVPVFIEKKADVSYYNDVFVLFFQPDGPYFDGLDYRTINKNLKVLNEVAGLLKENPEARLLIEGYANPVLGTQKEEYNALLPLSRQRANFIAQMLMASGISPGRFITVGEGGANPVVSINDRKNWEKNRRVELRILW